MVFPAHAGMSPVDAWQAARPGRFPRSRGDEPNEYVFFTGHI